MNIAVIVVYIWCQLHVALPLLSSLFFTEEPPNVVTFTNSSGATVLCKAGGNPVPVISWRWSEHELTGELLREFKSELTVRSDGALVFAPFSMYRYKKEIHYWAKFQCVAANKFGSIVSRETRVNAVPAQPMSVDVYDEFVIKGNVAVLKCQIEANVFGLISNFKWHFSDGFAIKSNETKGRYTVYPSGELHVRSVDDSDSHKTYRCEAQNGLTNESFISKNAAQLIVTEARNLLPPRITHRKSEIVVEEWEPNVMIPCAAEANPLPQYTWHRATKFGPISAVTMSDRLLITDGTLLLKRATVADSGRYVAIVVNSVGEERCVADLVVRSPLKTAIWPMGASGALQSTRGQSLNITCRVQGFPVDAVKWLHNMRTVSSFSSPVDKMVSLYVESLQTSDVGMYQCFAYNAYESAQAGVRVSLIDEPPNIVQTFDEQTLSAGASLSLRCVATGKPLSQIHWLIDGRVIPNFMRFRAGDYVTSDNRVVSYVNITSVRYEDGGAYRCMANNTVGVAYHEGRINVYGPPAIKPMPNVTFLSGDTGHLFCPYYGFPISSIEWFTKEGRKLPINGRQLVFLNGSLFISNVNKKADEGSYECVVKQDNLMAKSSVYVKVMVGPRIDAFSFPRNLEEGMRNVLICAVIAGDPPISIKWLKDGQHHLPSDLQPEMVNEFTSSITFSSLRPQHSGQYTCIAGNNAATANHSATLLVNVAPYWLREPKNVDTIVGQTALIDCQAGGIPEPQIIWKQLTAINENSVNGRQIAAINSHSNNQLLENFKTITSNPHIQILENGSLVVKEVNKYDSKKYICTAFNGINPSLSSIIDITVNSPPQFTEKFQSILAKRGEVIRLECNPIADSKDGIEFQWKKNSIAISLDSDQYREESSKSDATANSSSTLIVHSVQRFDSSIFTCLAINRFGTDEKRYRIVVQEVPDSPFDLKAKLVTSDSATISWSQPYNGNSPIGEYLIECKPVLDLKWSDSTGLQKITTLDTSALIKNLRPLNAYHVRVRASNSIGDSQFSETITVTTLEEPPSVPPADIAVVAVGARSLKISWSAGLTTDGRHSMVKGYYVGYRAHSSDNSFVFKTIDTSMMSASERFEYQINNLMKHTKYDIRTQAFNSAGSGPPSKDVIGQTLEFDVPNAPVVRVSSSTSNSIQIELSVFGDEPVSGFIIFYRGEDKQWNESKISALKAYIIGGLKCGTRYQIYVTAFNTAGQSDSSDVILARTEGNAPVAPEKSSTLRANSTSVTINLNAWRGIGCPINSFVIQYKKQFDRDWSLVSPDPSPSESPDFLIDNLEPGMWYNLLVTANSEAGNTDAEYQFSTNTLTGATISPFSAQTRPDIGGHRLMIVSGSGRWLLSQLNFVIPITCAILIVILVTVVICVLQTKHGVRRPTSGVLADHNPFKSEETVVQSVGHKDRDSNYDSFVEIPTNLSHSKSESVYLPTPYATSRVAFVAQSDDSDCPDIGLHSAVSQVANRNHVYDVPFIMKRVISDGNNQYSCVNKSMSSLTKSDSFHSPLDDFAHHKQSTTSIQKTKNLVF